MPVLTTADGKNLSQSNAILRYLGQTYGYYPKDAFEGWAADSLIDSMLDMMQGMIKARWEADE